MSGMPVDLKCVEGRASESLQPRRSFSGPRAATLAGITYRQLDFWARTGVVVPSVEAHGSGSARKYSESEVLALAVVGAASRAGLAPSALRSTAQAVAAYPGTPPRHTVIDFPLLGGGGLVLRVPLGQIAESLTARR